MIASGSDLFGQNSNRKALELELKAAVIGSAESLISATQVNAKLMGMDAEIGTLENGKLAALIIVDGNPVDNIDLLQDQDNINLVMQSGRVVKNQVAD